MTCGMAGGTSPSALHDPIANAQANIPTRLLAQSCGGRISTAKDRLFQVIGPSPEASRPVI
jgi:hypothetical protein